MEQRVRIEGIQRIMIHSSDYVRVYFTTESDPETVQPCQLPLEAFDQDLNVGDWAIATMLMRTVMEIRRSI